MRRSRINEDNGASGVELGIERIEALVAEIEAVEISFQDDAIGSQLVERLARLQDRALRIRQRRRRKKPEPAFMTFGQARAFLVHPAGEGPSRPVLAEVDARRRDRKEGRFDAETVHRRQSAGRAPIRHRGNPVRPVEAVSLELRPIEVWDEMAMDVDPFQPDPGSGSAAFFARPMDSLATLSVYFAGRGGAQRSAKASCSS